MPSEGRGILSPVRLPVPPLQHGRLAWSAHRPVHYAKRETRRALEPWLLYDNQKDPYQMRSVIEEPAYRQRREELEAMLVQWLKRVGDA